MSMRNWFRAGALAGAIFISGAALAQSFDGEIGAGHVLGNPAASATTATDATLSAMFDRAFCGTNNSMIARLAGTWGCTTTTPSGFTLNFSTGVLVGQIPFANGGCNGTTQQSCFDNAAPTATRAGVRCCAASSRPQGVRT